MRLSIIVIALLAAAGTARAWDAQESWNNPANGGKAPPGDINAITPGGGGIFGTGGARDYNITCASCHINDKQQQGTIDLAFAFNPALPALGGQQAYKPGQLYMITVNLLNEHLGQSNCSPYVTGNINNFAASIEDASGKGAGVVTSDSGQSSAACPAALPTVTGGTTMTYGDCHAVFSMGGDKADANRAQWSFSWQAPAAGTGGVTVSWGAVDGDCLMDSLGDDVKVGSLRLVEGSALAPTRRRRTARIAR